MEYDVTSIRPFIGAKDYELSRSFYLDLGFEERKISPKMSYFMLGKFGFYLQNAYVKDWVNNSMLFLEVKDLEAHLLRLKDLGLQNTYKSMRISHIHYNDWGKEFFLYDPSGILWHIGEFTQ